MNYTQILDTALWWSITLMVSTFYIFSANDKAKYLQVLLTCVIGGLCALRYWKKLELRITAFHIWVFLFGLFACVSYFWALIPEMAIKRGIVIFQSLVYMSAVYIYAIHQDSTTPLMDAIRWAGYIMAIYLLLAYGWGNLRYMMQESMRIDSDLINSNVIGMISAFSIILTLYRWIFVKFSAWYLLALPELAILSISASRKAFILLVLGSAAVFGIRYLKKNILSNIISILVMTGIIIGVGYLLLSLPMFERMRIRLVRLLGFFSSDAILDRSAFTRQQMIIAGFQQFLQTPLLGVGLGSTQLVSLRAVGRFAYLHNNYVEMLAGGGLVGTLLYYAIFWMTGVPLFRQRGEGDANTVMCLILMFLMLIMDWGAVSYYEKGTYFFFLLFFVQIQMNRGKKQQKSYEKDSTTH